MEPKDFLKQIDESAVLAAIRSAESRTSGEIRVYVSHKPLGKEDVIARAQARFVTLEMTRTRERNGVLIYVNPCDRKFAIIGDAGIHEKCGDAFWQSSADLLAGHLAAGRATEGLVAAVREIGLVLGGHFPRHSTDRNELPDDIARD